MTFRGFAGQQVRVHHELRRSFGTLQDGKAPTWGGSVLNAVRAMTRAPLGTGGAPTFDQAGHESLMLMAREIGRELQSDGMLIAWQDSGRDAVRLFADDVWDAEAGAERDILERASRTGGARTALARSEWHALDGEGETGVLTTSIPADGGTVTLATLFRRLGASTKSRASEALARLLPLVQPFFALWTTRLRAAGRLKALTAAINRSDVGVLIVDVHGRLTFANEAAEALIARNDGLRRKGDLIAATTLSDTLRLQAAIEHVVSPASGKARTARAPVIALSRASGRQLMAAVVPLDGETAHDDDAAIIYVFDPGQELRLLLEPVCQLYGLSPVETRLTCLLADGLSLAEAARATRVQELTARSYLKQVFLKTSTKRQGELVGLMLKSAVRIAPDCRTTLV